MNLYIHLFTYVMGHGHTHPGKSVGVSHNMHYATKIMVAWLFLAARNTCKGVFICRIREMAGGRGCSGFFVGIGGLSHGAMP